MPSNGLRTNSQSTLGADLEVGSSADQAEALKDSRENPQVHNADAAKGEGKNRSTWISASESSGPCLQDSKSCPVDVGERSLLYAMAADS